jgi:ribosomal 30S subunit maturation factor RimM
MLDDEKASTRDVTRGMDVCDVSGEKVGTVARVHRSLATREIIEVKTGLLGLGKHLFVPAEEVDRVSEAGLILKHTKYEFHDVGLDARPDDLRG